MILERVSCGRTGDEPRCISCQHWDEQDPGPNRLSRERAITLEHGDYAGLGGRCQLRDHGAMSKGWCREWDGAEVSTAKVSFMP
ncbi:hypothetical protein [uncultured Enterovirga sp.]|uniref:hypothetical protein n=1 Tax=uncultured Enterovirga sp. TaxID=2026352 RepID=UPI0035CAF342